MKFRLKVNVKGRTWKLGLNVYETYEDAIKRQAELKATGIKSTIVDEFGGKLK